MSLPITLEFQALHSYDPKEEGITVPIALRCGDKFVDIGAKVDTGASFCIFECVLGDRLGLDVENGVKERLGTAVGETFYVYGHSVTLEVLGLQFDSIVYFAEDGRLRRNVLGRHGWLHQCRIGIIDHDCKLFMSLYDS